MQLSFQQYLQGVNIVQAEEFAALMLGHDALHQAFGLEVEQKTNQQIEALTPEERAQLVLETLH